MVAYVPEQTTMTDNERRGWERKEDLVMESLQHLRLSADAALKGVNDLKTDLAVLNQRQEQSERENKEIQARLDRAQLWLMGILASLLVFGFQQLWAFMAASQHVAK